MLIHVVDQSDGVCVSVCAKCNQTCASLREKSDVGGFLETRSMCECWCPADSRVTLEVWAQASQFV